MFYFIYRFKKLKSSLPSEIDTDLCFWEINITLVESLDVIFLYFIHDATYFFGVSGGSGGFSEVLEELCSACSAILE